MAKRAVFYIGGYDPKSDEAFFDRVEKESGRYETLVDASVTRHTASKPHDDVTCTRFETTGQDWETVTDFHFLSLDDIVLKDFDRPFAVRFARSFITTWDYLLTGTAFKFLKHAWRFFIYFAYPPMAVTISVILAIIMAMQIRGFPFAPQVSWAVFALIMFGFVQLFWKRKYVMHLMDLWSFSRDYLRRKRNDIDAKLDRFAQIAVNAARSEKYDEIVLVGHSTGAALILDVAARATKIDPEFANHATHTTLLTVGSTALKIGLHPAAQWYRDRLQTMFATSSIGWVEYQCHSDLINFYRTQPAELMGIDTHMQKRPIVRTIRMKQMVPETIYNKMRKNFFRIHYQFVFGNTKPYHYDFMGICFGPNSVYRRATSRFIEGQDT